MVQEEQWITRAVGRITRSPKYTAYAKMSTSVYIALIETWDAFHSAREAGVVWLIHNFLDELGVREGVHDPGDEIATETVAGGEVEHELFRDEGAVLDAAATSVAGDIEWVLLGSGLDVGAIATETVVGTEDGRFIRSSGGGVPGFCVEGPVPIATWWVIMLISSGRRHGLLTAGRQCNHTRLAALFHT
jgi:hypothetical protein